MASSSSHNARLYIKDDPSSSGFYRGPWGVLVTMDAFDRMTSHSFLHMTEEEYRQTFCIQGKDDGEWYYVGKHADATHH